MNHLYILLSVCRLAVMLTVAFPALAQGQTLLTATDRGWYVNNGFHGPDNDNYLVGDPGNAGDTSEYRNWFVFSLAGVTQPLQSAELRLFNPISPPGAANGFESVDPTETYTVFDVTASITNLVTGTNGLATFTDLGTGTIFGTRVMSVADNGTTVVISLNASGLAYLNANLGSDVAFGGALTTLDGDFAGTGESAFGATRSTQPSIPPTAAQLSVVAVPEPATWGLIGLSASTCLGAWYWRRRQWRQLASALVDENSDSDSYP